MIKKIVEFFKDKKIAILGFGLEGKSTYKFIRKYLPKQQLYILDKCGRGEVPPSPDMNYAEIEEDKNLKFITGEEYLNNLECYDVIMKSPGISFKDIDISKIKEKIYSQLELFLEHTKSFTIGITGTKGKSTTSSLIYEILANQDKDVKLLGNIGLPIFDEIEKINDDTIVVLEMSSHGLQYTDKSPNISILLNVFEEHLDHYKSFEEYRDAKFNIFNFQGKKDVAIFNLENEEMKKKEYQYKETDYGITINNIENTNTKNTIYKKDDYIFFNENKIYNVKSERKLKGNHNLNDIMFVLAVSNILNLNLEKTIETINEFNPLEHRLEFVGTIDGVEYYNDSIATVPEAAIESIRALGNVNTLIVGGNDRGVNQQNLINFLKESDIKNIICLPKTGEYIYDGLQSSNKKIYKVKDMKQAVNIAKQVTKKSTVCLLSPAASSFGYFKNFKERGNMFKEYVKNN